MSGIKLGQGKRTIRNIKSNVIDPHCVAWRDEQGMVWPPGLCCRNIEELLQWVKAWFPLVASPGDGVGGVLLWPHQCTGIAESLPKGRTKISLVSIQKFENQQFMNTSVHPEQPKQTKANQSMGEAPQAVLQWCLTPKFCTVSPSGIPSLLKSGWNSETLREKRYRKAWGW